ncbi:hypothetical protein H9P43_007353 [Blastocladiella emersonii ATCC 22665]|nr:hypothetical protein H9P43_007353 [Blastocladiella emersonii ATCC 22665]
MSKIAAIPALNRQGQATVAPAKVQRYRRGQAPEGAASASSSSEDSDDDDAVAHRAPRAGAAGPAMGFRSAKPEAAAAAFTPITLDTNAAGAAAEMDPRLRRLAALRQQQSMAPRRRARAVSSSSDEDDDGAPRRRVAPESSDDDDEEEEERALPGVRARGTTLQAQAERREMLRLRLLEQEALARVATGGARKESSSEEEDSDEEESSEEEDEAPRRLIKPVFVPKHLRQNGGPSPARAPTPAELAEADRARREAERQQRRAEARALVEAELKREHAAAAELATAADVDDTDDADPSAEHAAWRARELARLRRALDARLAYEAELADLERRRNMTDEEKRAEADRVQREREDAQRSKPKIKFMQKYHHKGAFYLDSDVVQRNANGATGEDHFNYEALPEVLQRRNFGLAGQTKWTHLVKEDTSKKDTPRYADRELLGKVDRKRGGMGDIDAAAKRPHVTSDKQPSKQASKMRNPFATMEAGGQDSGIMDDACASLNLTRKQRLIGFGVCFVVGLLISFLSFLSVATGNIIGFAILYTFGNVTSLMSTSFLTGPAKQLKGMFDTKRRIASIVYLGALVTTLVVAFTTKSAGLCLIFCLIQFLALFWYSASYIPFARDIIKNAIGIRS